jgi:hypothetical protein
MAAAFTSEPAQNLERAAAKNTSFLCVSDMKARIGSCLLYWRTKRYLVSYMSAKKTFVVPTHVVSLVWGANICRVSLMSAKTCRDSYTGANTGCVSYMSAENMSRLIFECQSPCPLSLTWMTKHAMFLTSAKHVVSLTWVPKHNCVCYSAKKIIDVYLTRYKTRPCLLHISTKTWPLLG